MVNKQSLKQKGSALISALFIMTLVAIATTAMSVRLQQDIYRTQLSLTSDKLYLASQAVIFWAMGVLAQDPIPTDPLLLQYPKANQKDYPNITTTGKILDLQARFNLNQLKETESDEDNQFMQTSFYQLLHQVLTDTDPKLQRTIADATKHWVNDYKKGQGLDENSAYYLKQKPPYSPSNQLMQSVSEFRMVNGVDDKIYQAMAPYITALPPPTLININTAPVKILTLLGTGLEERDAEAIIQARGPQGFKNINEVNELLKKYDIPVKQITLESEYFLCVATVTSNQLTLIHYVIIKRVKNQGKIITHIIHDTLNDL